MRLCRCARAAALAASLGVVATGASAAPPSAGSNPCYATGSPLAIATLVPRSPVLASACASTPEDGAAWRGGEATAEADSRAAVVPELWLAQRSIEREWLAHDDSASIAGRVAGGRSEIAAGLLSAILPGSGELYVGERSGYAFLATEIASVIGLVISRRGAEDLREDAARLAGAPTDSASAWSFDRWSTATGGDASELETIYAHDPEAFWERLDHDSGLDAGWSTATEAADFSNLRSRAIANQRRSNQLGAIVWLNHVASAADALRAARLRNLSLGRHFELRARGGFQRGEPSFRVTLAGRF